MTREEAKELQPIIQAYAEGKTIQFLTVKGDWKDWDDPVFLGGYNFRIKPEQKYRPFKSQEECWQEMQKHHPFGWIKRNGKYVGISMVSGDCSYDDHFKDVTFADGTPFGMKEK